MTEKPFIPRGLMHVPPAEVWGYHGDGTISFTNALPEHTRTYHRVAVLDWRGPLDNIEVLVTPSTVVTWDRLP